MIFLDFKRDFEIIDRDILLKKKKKKLHKYGFVELYLTNRRQYTNVNNIISDSIENNFEVLQESVLGALRFIIYVNNIEIVLEKCEIVLYADDTLIITEAVLQNYVMKP